MRDRGKGRAGEAGTKGENRKTREDRGRTTEGAKEEKRGEAGSREPEISRDSPLMPGLDVFFIGRSFRPGCYRLREEHIFMK